MHSKHSKDGQTFLKKHAMLLQNDALILEIMPILAPIGPPF